MRDRTFGALALAALTRAFVYYTLWLLGGPLVSIYGDDGFKVSSGLFGFVTSQI